MKTNKDFNKVRRKKSYNKHFIRQLIAGYFLLVEYSSCILARLKARQNTADS